MLPEAEQLLDTKLACVSASTCMLCDRSLSLHPQRNAEKQWHTEGSSNNTPLSGSQDHPSSHQLTMSQFPQSQRSTELLSRWEPKLGIQRKGHSVRAPLRALPGVHMRCICVLCVQVPTGCMCLALLLLDLWHGAVVASLLSGCWIQHNIVSPYIIHIICFKSEVRQILLTEPHA